MSAPRQPELEHARLVGERVVLRPLAVTDVPRAWSFLRDGRAITDWLLWDGPSAELDLVPWYSRWALRDEDGCDYHFAVCDPERELFHGAIGLRFAGHPYQADLGYWLAPDCWGRGWMTEAVALVTWLAFEHLEAWLCYAQTFAGNEGSVRVLERCGYERDPAGDAVVQKRGEPRAEEFRSLSRTTWLERGRPGAPRGCDVQLRARE
ncbi:MAG: GNAT family N-acetyltransferase [Planctomycetes bacterium]|nr:GNAT family N-acetyltransferase [Planctomycetota bacterium]